jgi:hypothetical protein
VDKQFRDFILKQDATGDYYMIGYESGTYSEVRIPIAALKGADGASIELQYSVDGTHWHNDHTVSDLYMRMRSGDGAWTSAMLIVATDGKDGKIGADGATIITGAAVPTGTTGEIGDIYIDTSTCQLYQKTAPATWTAKANIKGTQGPQYAPSFYQFTESGALLDIISATATDRVAFYYLSIGDKVRNIQLAKNNNLILSIFLIRNTTDEDIDIAFSVPAGNTFLGLEGVKEAEIKSGEAMEFSYYVVGDTFVMLGSKIN